jgi:ribosomal-protein-alanine N-acetyltransferase
MQETDLVQVAQIEQCAFPDPWPIETFRTCLQAGLCCWVLARHSSIDAYGIMALKTDTAHIMNLCVRPESQRQGLGRQMLAHLLALARSRQATTVLLEVRVSNRAAIALYEAMGFTTVRVRKAYYRTAQGREDALVMACHL